MRHQSPFQQDDLADLAAFLDRASAVAPMGEIAAGLHDKLVIGMRHDVDNHIEPAVAMAEWEAEHGYRSTYFILHTAPYWRDKDKLRASLDAITGFGHEIGFHINAITEAIHTGRDPIRITIDALVELRGYSYPVTGVVAHGDQACYTHRFINDELFYESRRPEYGAADRVIAGRRLQQISRTTLGLTYDPNWMPRAEYISDSGGEWSKDFDGVSTAWPYEGGQLHMLVHPDWWGEAFAAKEAA
jgi:hypothetical protein